MNYKDAEKDSILLTVVGSRAYGTNTPTSDWDYKGVVIPPMNCFVGLKRFDQVGDGADKVIYNIRKFFQLALNTNPNIYDVIYGPSDCIVKVDKFGEKLIENRDLFLSQKARYSYVGYAYSQIHRIRKHRGYLLGNHPKSPPDPSDFGIDHSLKLGKDETRAIESLAFSIISELENQFYKRIYTVKQDGRISFDKEKAVDVFMELVGEEYFPEYATIVGMPKNVMAAFYKVKAYRSKLREWKQYQEWVKGRNPERAELEKKYGYDCKHAMHTVRLLKMGKEILKDGTVNVRRPDAEELLAIRNGAWTYDQLIEWADKKDEEIRNIKSTLKKTPNHKKAEQLLMELILEKYGR